MQTPVETFSIESLVLNCNVTLRAVTMQYDGKCDPMKINVIRYITI